MAISLKNDEIFKLLSQYKYLVSNDITDNYKCGICKKLLINAHQATCGCHFCYDCINQYMADGSINCPNNTNECDSESLSNIAPNFKLNRSISNLIVQCPNKMCLHKCRFIELEDHLNSCLKKDVKCPFNNVGCEHDDIINDELKDHMLSDIYNHNKILIGLIDNLRSEMRELKEKVDKNQSEIEILKEIDLGKTKKIESLQNEIQTIKQNNEDLVQKMEIGNRNLWYKYDEVNKELKEKCNDDSMKSLNEEIHSIKVEREELSQKVLSIEENVKEKNNIEINESLDNMKKNFDEKLEKFLKIIEEKDQFQTELKSEMNDINKFMYMRHHGELKWDFGKISEIEEMPMSDYFYDKKNPYKMRIGIRNVNEEFVVSFFMYSGEFDEDLKWPCKADVTISLYSAIDILKFKFMKKYCLIDKPNYIFPKTISFVFSHESLTSSNLLNVKCLLRCRVKFVSEVLELPS